MIIRMRGLPYLTTREQVVEFFASNKPELSNEQNEINNSIEIIKKGIESSNCNQDNSSNSSVDKNDLNNNQIKEDVKLEKKQIAKLDKAYCRVMHGVDGVLFVRTKNGKPSGDCFVLFENEQQGQLALTKHRELIGK